ncbi:MAG TPA: hypothetical protein VMV14_07780 [Acidimicrobiales bacterium]|nr:hypothetical protein [Acidimicrobiales bacterium]
MRTWCRLAAVGCLAGAGAAWFGMGSASAATTAGPARTAWYDNTGAQNVTGVTTPSAAQPGELQVSYVPAAATVPQQTLPAAPPVPGAPVAPPSGNVGGNTLGYTLSFAAVDYTVPTDVGGQPVDPSSITAVLTLSLNSASSGNVTNGDLIACPTTTTLWTGGGDQDSGAAPPYSCTNAVTGNVDTTANTVTFDLTSAQESSLSPGTFSLVIVPGSSPSGAFQAVISAPSSSSMAVTNESPMGSPNTNLDGATYSSGNLAGSTDAGAGSGAFALQTFSPAGAVSTPASGSTSIAPAAGSSTYAAAAPAALHGGLGSGAQRTVALVVLLALGALLVLASSNPARAPRSLRALLATNAAAG